MRPVLRNNPNYHRGPAPAPTLWERERVTNIIANMRADSAARHQRKESAEMTMTVNDDHFLQVGECTCCDVPRQATRSIPMIDAGYDNDGAKVPDWDSHEEWAHVEDSTFAEMSHVHVDTQSRDCDSTYDRSWVFPMSSYSEGGISVDATPSDLWRQVAERSLPIHAESAIISVSTNRITWNETTDEGYSAGEIRMCTDPNCAHEDETFRDATAEAAGY